MDHRSPVAFVTTPTFGISGFNNSRTADITAPQSGVSIAAAQAPGAANIVYGFGMVAGSYATQSPPQTFGGPGGPDITFDLPWNVPARLATGSFAVGGSFLDIPHIDEANMPITYVYAAPGQSNIIEVFPKNALLGQFQINSASIDNVVANSPGSVSHTFTSGLQPIGSATWTSFGFDFYQTPLIAT